MATGPPSSEARNGGLLFSLGSGTVLSEAGLHALEAGALSAHSHPGLNPPSECPILELIGLFFTPMAD